MNESFSIRIFRRQRKLNSCLIDKKPTSRIRSQVRVHESPSAKRKFPVAREIIQTVETYHREVFLSNIVSVITSVLQSDEKKKRRGNGNWRVE